MINFGAPNITIDERVDSKITKAMYAFVQSDGGEIATSRYNFNTILNRYAAEDLYSIVTQYDGNLNRGALSHDKYGHELVTIINNKIKLQKHFVLGERDYEVRDGKILFHHSEINEKLRKTNYIFSFLRARRIYSKTGNNWRFNESQKPLFSKLISYASFLKFPEFQKNYKIASDGLVRMRFLKKMSIREVQAAFLKHYSTAKNQKIQNFSKTEIIKPYLSYSNFYINFNKLNWIDHQHEIATIFWRPNTRSEVFDSDFKFQKGSYLKLGTKKYNLTFVKDKLIAAKLKSYKFKRPIEVGKVILSDFTSYDYKKMKPTSDINEFAARGIFIPYQFRGKFFYKVRIGINDVFKDLDFFVYQDVAQQALDPYAGKIRVKITTKDAIASELASNAVVISSHHFKTIIDLGTDVHPLAIARFANVKKEEEE